MARTTPERIYRHLEARPDAHRKQLWLKGRRMTVGQLVASISAEKLTAEKAAARFALPLEQVQEALDYFEANRDLVNRELRSEKKWLREHGYAVEPEELPGWLEAQGLVDAAEAVSRRLRQRPPAR